MLGSQKRDVVYGTNTSFTAFSSGTLTFQSPLLAWSEDSSYMKFKSIVAGTLTDFEVQVEIVCRKVLTAQGDTVKWSQDLSVADSEINQCFQVINYAQDPSLCAAFRVNVKVTVTGDNVTISGIEFGGSSLCSLSEMQPSTTFDCNLDHGDCGIRNDACGLARWELRPQSADETSKEKRSSCGVSKSGIPLIIKQLHSECAYHLDIASLQPSGFLLLNDVIDTTSQSASRRKRDLSGYSLVLDPTTTSGVATGILDLPTVTHAIANAYLTFDYEMYEDGAHDLMVTAVCTSDPTNYLVPLKPSLLHYHKLNLYAGSGGTLLLDVHAYVHQEDCSTFAIQLHGAAVDTYLTVDDLVFHASAPTGMSE